MLKIIEGVPRGGDIPAGIGQVIALPGPEATLGIGTGEGVLGVLKVQLAGRKVMTAAEFVRGQRDFVGSVLPS
jgi:methionyl-tRNA formyltransferase